MRRNERAFLWATLVAGVFLLLNLRTGPGSLDGPEIVAAVRGLGQIHPPGHPAFLGLSMIFMLLPLGDAAFRLAAFSGVALSLSAGMMALLLDRVLLSRSFARERQALRTVVVVAMAVTSVCVPGVFEQGIRTEVYALQVLFCVSALYLLMKCQSASAESALFVALGLLEGLALAHHHYLTVLSLAPATFWVLWRQARRGRATLQVTLGCCVGLTPYLAYLSRDPAASQLYWFDTQSIQGFLDMVMARTFHASLTSDPRADILANLPLALGMLPEFAGVLPFILGLLGLGLCLWRRSEFVGSNLMGLVMLGALLSKVLMYADPTNPDDRGYLALAMVIWPCFGVACVGPISDFLDRMAGAERQVGPWLCALLALGLMVERASTSMTSNETRSDPTPFLRSALAPIPANSLALVHYFQTHFLIQYGQSVEGRRPDILEAQASFGARVRAGEDSLALFERRHPELADMVAHIRRHGGISAPWLVDLSRRRTVVLDPAPEQQNLPIDHLEYREVFAKVRSEPAPPACVAEDLERTFGKFVGRGRATRDLLAFALLEHGVFHLRRGNAHCADKALSLLESLTGKSALLERLRIRVRGLFLRADPSGIVSPSPYRRMSFP